MSDARRESLRGHVLVLGATIAGVLGMGMVFAGMTSGSLIEVSKGTPLLLVGLWWAGRELGRSMVASRQKRSHPQAAPERAGSEHP